MLIDTHAHIYEEYYDNINEVIEKSEELGVTKIINAGCDDKSNKEVLKKAKEYNNLFAALGIQPEYANDYKDSDLDFIKDNLKNQKVVAIGEIGLDYHYEGYNKEIQIELLEKQLLIASKYMLPVVIHSREATMDTINTLKMFPSVRGVIHSFTGSIETAKEYIKMGYLLGVGGVSTFKNAHIKEVIKEVGINNIILETDSPYLTPEPFRGKKNIPGNVHYVADFLSKYLDIPYETIEKITTSNALKLFKKMSN